MICYENDQESRQGGCAERTAERAERIKLLAAALVLSKVFGIVPLEDRRGVVDERFLEIARGLSEAGGEPKDDKDEFDKWNDSPIFIDGDQAPDGFTLFQYS